MNEKERNTKTLSEVDFFFSSQDYPSISIAVHEAKAFQDQMLGPCKQRDKAFNQLYEFLRNLHKIRNYDLAEQEKI